MDPSMCNARVCLARQAGQGVAIACVLRRSPAARSLPRKGAHMPRAMRHCQQPQQQHRTKRTAQIGTVKDPELRVQIVSERSTFDEDPASFHKKYADKQVRDESACAPAPRRGGVVRRAAPTQGRALPPRVLDVCSGRAAASLTAPRGLGSHKRRVVSTCAPHAPCHAHTPHHTIRRQRALTGRIVDARTRLKSVAIPYDFRVKISAICSELNVDGIRGDIVTNRCGGLTGRCLTAGVFDHAC
jgi:hypothetical protein